MDALSRILTYKNIKYGLVFATVFWVFLIVVSVEIVDNLDKNIFDRSVSTGFSYVDSSVKYFYAITQADFNPFDFISTRYFSIYLTIFLASLGAFGGFLQLWEKLRPVTHKDFSSERRRNVLLLLAAICSSIIVGCSTVLSSVRKEYLLKNFYMLEVNLVRFEGLMFGSFSISANPKLVDTFMIYLVGYAARIQQIISDISRAYDFNDENKFQTMVSNFSESVKQLKEHGFDVTEQVSDTVYGDVKISKPLYDLLTQLESMQETVRRHIRGRKMNSINE